MLGKFISKLENEDHPLLAPTLWGLKTWGIWQQDSFSPKINNSIHIAAIIFVISQYIELWNIRADLNLALRNLSVTMLSTVCVVKAGSFVIWQNYWKSVIEYVSAQEKEQISKKDKITDTIIGEYTKYARRVTYFYWSLVFATVVTVILAPLAGFLTSSTDNRERIRNGSAPYPEIMSSWVPFDRTRGVGYWVTALEHILTCFYGGGVVATYDTNAVVIMTFLTGQLKLLGVNCSRLFDDEALCYEDEMKKIIECHRHHTLLLKHSKVLNDLLSPVMFLYVIICSLMICASAIQMTAEGTTNMQRIWLAEYLMALIAQLFLYCWHCNEVLVMSNKVDNEVYASAWWSRNMRLRRSVLVLGGKLRRSVVFSAGPFTHLTVATFLAILKGSYSYYTILNR